MNNPTDARPRTVTVFCGSRVGARAEFAAATAELGTGLARAGIRIVYGGGGRGLMGVLADAALAEGGEVIGIIPRFLQELEVAHTGLTELIVVDGMQTRKEQLIGRGDAILVLPGGLGTLDEFFEALTFKNLGLHNKPILICNVLGWFDATQVSLQSAVHHGFVDNAVHRAIEMAPDVGAILARLETVE